MGTAPAVSPCRAGPEYQVHRGDGRKPDCTSPSAFQHQAGRKVKMRVSVPRVKTQPRFLCLAFAGALLGVRRGPEVLARCLSGGCGARGGAGLWRRVRASPRRAWLLWAGIAARDSLHLALLLPEQSRR